MGDPQTKEQRKDGSFLKGKWLPLMMTFEWGFVTNCPSLGPSLLSAHVLSDMSKFGCCNRYKPVGVFQRTKKVPQQWRIQDFSEEGTNPEGVHQVIITGRNEVGPR